MTHGTKRRWPVVVLAVQILLDGWLAVALPTEAGFPPEEWAPLLVGAVALTGLIAVGVTLSRRAPGHPLVPAPCRMARSRRSTAPAQTTAWNASPCSTAGRLSVSWSPGVAIRPSR
jgi:hypothetical protein